VGRNDSFWSPWRAGHATRDRLFGGIGEAQI
jgi:hypothetical protein